MGLLLVCYVVIHNEVQHTKLSYFVDKGVVMALSPTAALFAVVHVV